MAEDKRTPQAGPPPGIDVEQLAALARLRLSPAEKADIEQELQDILALAGGLSALDSAGAAPGPQDAPLYNVAREDAIVPPQGGAWLLDGAPAARDGCILVPRAVD